ncbi:MAG: sigma factor-like helix-turn-helix DNA-binding protein [Candidatus Pacebacteria bacterium]|nr:sigma factor-like helix-turn-helix DNA-binding protein [Candidatus Paceibacterota bacterium]
MKKVFLDGNNPQALSLKIIAVLPSRNQEIIKKRFGIEDDKPKTLEAVGQTYKITRERVRQIIESALKTIKKQPISEIIGEFANLSKSLLKESGGLEEEREFLKKVDKALNANRKSGEKGNLSAIKFLLILSPDFVLEEESESNHSFWHLREISKETIIKNIKALEKYFKNKKRACLLDEILAWAKKNISAGINEEELEAYFRISKKIGTNPFGEYGLFTLAEIDPVGTREKAYLLMKHLKEPMHFSEITERLNEINKLPVRSHLTSHSWQKKVCIQTVHNELIRDPRFVLIGRGIYALRESGYKPGKIVDIIQDVLKEAGKPLEQEDIIKEVKKRRIAKDNTIILNLHNKQYFKKLPDKRYTLVKPYKILEV